MRAAHDDDRDQSYQYWEKKSKLVGEKWTRGMMYGVNVKLGLGVVDILVWSSLLDNTTHEFSHAHAA